MEDLLRNLGHRIRDLRIQRGWSQEKFSEICDVHRTWMGQIERGKNISVTTLANIADGLEVTLSTLLEGVEGGKKDRAAGPEAGKALKRIEPMLRARHQTVSMLVEELRAHRRHSAGSCTSSKAKAEGQISPKSGTKAFQVFLEITYANDCQQSSSEENQCGNPGSAIRRGRS